MVFHHLILIYVYKTKLILKIKYFKLRFNLLQLRMIMIKIILMFNLTYFLIQLLITLICDNFILKYYYFLSPKINL